MAVQDDMENLEKQISEELGEISISLDQQIPPDRTKADAFFQSITSKIDEVWGLISIFSQNTLVLPKNLEEKINAQRALFEASLISFSLKLSRKRIQNSPANGNLLVFDDNSQNSVPQYVSSALENSELISSRLADQGKGLEAADINLRSVKSDITNTEILFKKMHCMLHYFQIILVIVAVILLLLIIKNLFC